MIQVTVAFQACKEADLDRQYGQSGQTCRQILEEYRRGRELWTEVYAWVSALWGRTLGVSRSQCGVTENATVTTDIPVNPVRPRAGSLDCGHDPRRIRDGL